VIDNDSFTGPESELARIGVSATKMSGSPGLTNRSASVERGVQAGKSPVYPQAWRESRR
jgi:hypothetical protein